MAFATGGGGGGPLPCNGSAQTRILLLKILSDFVTLHIRNLHGLMDVFLSSHFYIEKMTYTGERNCVFRQTLQKEKPWPHLKELHMV